MASSIRLVIVEDHEMVREALSGLLQATAGLQVVGCAGSIRDALPILESTHPDIALVDLSLEDGVGTELVRAVRRRRLKTRVLIMTGYRDSFAATEAMNSGAAGFILKTRPTAELIEAVHRVMAGEAHVSADVPAALVPPDQAASGLERLSRREGEVFRLVVSGWTSREIASRLCISIKTVETHRAKINRKLSVNRPSDLVRFAVAHGISVAPESVPERPPRS
jgi:two-component system nitrate/nitrite response regulator NarL